MTLSEFPSHLAAIVASVPAEKMSVRASDGRFALVEHVWHLADLEEEGYGTRIIRLLSENRPSLPDFRGGVLAEERKYIEQDVHPALERFTRVRSMNAMLLESLSEEQRRRAGEQEGVGEVTLGRVEEMMRAHDGEHAAEIADLLGELGVTVI